MDFSGIQKAAQEVKTQMENKFKYFNEVEEGLYLCLFLYAESYTSQKNFNTYYNLNFNLLKVLDGNELFCDKTVYKETLATNEYLLKNTAKLINNIFEIPFDDISPEVCKAFYSGSEENGDIKGDMTLKPVFVEVKENSYTCKKTNVLKKVKNVNIRAAHKEDLIEHDLEELVDYAN